MKTLALLLHASSLLGVLGATLHWKGSNSQRPHLSLSRLEQIAAGYVLGLEFSTPVLVWGDRVYRGQWWYQGILSHRWISLILPTGPYRNINDMIPISDFQYRVRKKRVSA